MLTRCPHCTTTFRVKPEQLKARLGRVRCGECKTVFNALDSLVEEMPPTPAAAEAAEVSTLQHFAPQTVEVTPSHEAAPTPEPQAELANSEPVEVPAAEIEPSALASAETEAEEAAPALMEAAAEPELKPEPEPEAKPEAPSVSAVVEEPEHIAAEPEAVHEPEPATTEPSAPAQQEPIIESATAEDPQPQHDAELVPDELTSETPAPLAEHKPEANPAPLAETPDDLDFTLTEVIEDPAAAAAEATVAADPISQETEAPSMASAATEEALSPAPTVAEQEPLLHHAPRAARRWPWAVLAVLAALLLAGQALVYYRVEVAVAAPALKPLLKAACEPLGCEVPRPRKSELLDIESSDLHPGKQKGRLELVAVLKNKAPFAQEWPVLEVSLTDVADKALIVKALQPADYLPAGRKPTAGFPAKAEINVNLTLDAGDTPASGYRLYLYYP